MSLFVPKVMRTTGWWRYYWKTATIDWEKEYGNWQHPHRYLIVALLKRMPWLSLIEVGCGAGANLVNIIKNIEGKQLGGIDINSRAIELCAKMFKGGLFKVNAIDDIMISDKATDVTLSDMTLIYMGPLHIRRCLRELKRVTRRYVVLCELHSNSWYERLVLRFREGLNAYNWPKILSRHGFYDTVMYKVPREAWPDSDLQQRFAYLIVSRVPKR